MTGRRRGDRATAAILRRALVALAAVNTAGIALELATLRHWKSPVQLIAWAAVALLGAATGVLAAGPSAGAVRAVRWLAGVVAAAAVVGVLEHVRANYSAGPLDAALGPSWDRMSPLGRLWAAGTRSVGPAPSLAPAALGFAALCLCFATAHHPALAAPPRPRPGARRLGRPPAGARLVRSASFVVDLASGRARTRFGEVRLAADEVHLLALLAQGQGRVIGPGRLAGEFGPDRVAASLAGLRGKLEPDPARPRHLLGGPGTGYRFQPGPPPRAARQGGSGGGGAGL